MVCPLAQFDPLNVRMKCDVPVTSPAFFTRFCVRVAKPHCRSRNDHKLRLSDVALIRSLLQLGTNCRSGLCEKTYWGWDVSPRSHSVLPTVRRLLPRDRSRV